MEFEPPLDPLELLLGGLWHGIQMFTSLVWSLPLWAKALLALLVVVRVRWRRHSTAGGDLAT